MNIPIDEISSLPQYQQDRILNGPASTPLNGTTSHFADPKNQDVLSYFLITLFLLVSSTATLICICSSLLHIKRVFLEDCTSDLVTELVYTHLTDDSRLDASCICMSSFLQVPMPQGRGTVNY